MKKKLLIFGVTGAIILSGGILAACSLNETYKLNSDEITVELGETLDTDVSVYVECSERIKDNVKIDVSNVDIMKVGSYTATVTYKENTMNFVVNVRDTTAPTVSLTANEFEIMVGETLTKEDIVAEMDDLAGISTSYILSEDDTSKNDTICYTEEGDYTDKLVVVDNNGNSTEKEFTVHVIPDYLTHVSGFHDWTVEQDADIDFTQGIEYDERIVSVTAGEIDLSQTGDQTLVYSITGDDNETIVEQSVIVTVVDAATAQTMANNNETVYVSGNATKTKEVQETKSSQNTSSNLSTNKTVDSNSTDITNNSGSSTNSDNNTAEDNYVSDSQEWTDSLEIGKTYDLGEPEGSGEFADGTGYSGTISW